LRTLAAFLATAGTIPVGTGSYSGQRAGAAWHRPEP